MKKSLVVIFLSLLIVSCTQSTKQEAAFMGASAEVKIVTIDPGHFHAALVQKIMYPQVSPEVYIYAPDGPDVEDHIHRIEGFNTREEEPTTWHLQVYTGQDYLEKMINEKPGNLMVTAGNNEKKTEYIKAAVDAGIHVLADKPMAINKEDFALLMEAFKSAKEHGVLLYDIMTERYEINSILQKELSLIPEIFGELESGSPDKPAVTKESVHHFFKYVAGNEIKRPAWFFDVSKEGDGIVDVTTHLVDLIQWECFPEQHLDYKKDIEMIRARRWPTSITPTQFKKVTRLVEYPDYLHKYLADTMLNVYCNGEMTYKIKGVHAKVSVRWDYRAPEGAGDTHYSIMRGTKAELVIRQGPEENYKTTLYINPVDKVDMETFEQVITDNMGSLRDRYPGLKILRLGDSWKVLVPEEYKVGHEAHFGQVMEKYLRFLVDRSMPDWEVPNMIAKYYTCIEALEMAKNK